MLRQMVREQTQYAEPLIPREIDPEVGTLNVPDEGNGPLIMRVLEDNMKGECRSPL